MSSAFTALDAARLLAQGRTLRVTVEPTDRGPRVVIDAEPMHHALPVLLAPVDALHLAADAKRRVDQLGGEGHALPLASFGMRLAYEAVEAFVAQAEAARRPATFEVITGGRSVGVG